jgi:phosphoglycolate phosphatase-like HAD superfamily hydrolase
VLFDVDGVLLLTHDEVYGEASRLALEAVFGIYAESPDVPGDTAPAHIRRALRTVGVSEAEIDAGLPSWCATFSDHYVRLLETADTSHWHLGQHAAEAATALEHRALLTGNPPAVAHARMERLGLAKVFPRGPGAFGCERENRSELFDLARERAGNWPRERTVAVGDTPLDVASAHAAGCLCIGVTTGRYRSEQLEEADVVIADLGELARGLRTLG